MTLNFYFIESDASAEALAQINTKLDTIVMKLSEAEQIIVEGAKKLGEAQTEILAKLAELEATDPDISPEGTAAVESIRTIATALADIVPNTPPVEPPVA